VFLNFHQHKSTELS